MWVKNNEPENYAKCCHILLPKDYIRYKLTGEFATEVSDASGMQLLDIKNRCWSDEVLEKLDIDKRLLAKVYESPDVTGTITKEISALTGVKEGTVVVGGAGDNAAAAVGTGVVEDGKAFTTIGTSGVVFAHTSEMVIDKKGRVHTFCCAVPGKWHVMGVTQAAGLSLQWFRRNLGENYTYDDFTQMASDIPIGCDNLLYMPYLMGERTPHLDADCRGAFVGLSNIHTRAHMARAVMEGVSYSLRDCMEILKGLDISVSDMAACGGGGSSPFWRQMLADLYSCNVKTVTSKEGPALGVAILAGVGAGIFPSVEEGCAHIIKNKSIQEPLKENTEEYEKYYEIYKDLYPALKDTFHKLQQI